MSNREKLGIIYGYKNFYSIQLLKISYNKIDFYLRK